MGRNEFTIRPSRGNRFVSWLMTLVVVVMIFVMGAAINYGCTAGDAGVNALEEAGYHDIELGGRAWAGCGEHDAMNSYFTAVNPSGRRVSGVVCCGLVMKACTVRF